MLYFTSAIFTDPPPLANLLLCLLGLIWHQTILFSLLTLQPSYWRHLMLKSLLFYFPVLSSTQSSHVPLLKQHSFFTVPRGEVCFSLGYGHQEMRTDCQKELSLPAPCRQWLLCPQRAGAWRNTSAVGNNWNISNGISAAPEEVVRASFQKYLEWLKGEEE